MRTPDELIAQNIRGIRAARNRTQADVVDDIRRWGGSRMSQWRLSFIETCKLRAEPEDLEWLARALDVPVEAFTGRTFDAGLTDRYSEKVAS